MFIELSRIISKAHIKPLSLLACLIAVVVTFMYWQLSRQESVGREIWTYDEFILAFDVQSIGVGTETTGEPNVLQPMACALIAHAAALQDDLAILNNASECILNARDSGNGTGWGLGWEWDAFNDGSTNPPDTVYGITTALAIEGLIFAYLVTENELFSEAAVAALDYYAQFTSVDDDGIYFWYSDQPSDAINVYNVSAMLAGVYALAADKFGRADYRQLAIAAARTVALGASNGDRISWRYSHVMNSPPNDLVHAAYIVYGISRVQFIANEQLIELGQLVEYLSGFFDNGELLEFRRDERDIGRRARGWGLGMAAYVTAFMGHRDLAEHFLSYLNEYEFAPNQFSYVFGDELNVPRSNAHILLALAAIESEIIK